MEESKSFSANPPETNRDLLDTILEKHRLDEIDLLSLDKALWLETPSSLTGGTSNPVSDSAFSVGVDASGSIDKPPPGGSPSRGSLMNKDGTQQPTKIRSKYTELIYKAANANGLDPVLFEALIWAESDFNPKCRSGVGAMGLAQLMPPTARMLGVKDPWDPEQNLMGGAKYLAMQFKTFKDTSLALAAYNAGPGNVRKYKGIPPFTETRNYVKKILKKYQEYKSGK